MPYFISPNDSFAATHLFLRILFGAYEWVIPGKPFAIYERRVELLV